MRRLLAATAVCALAVGLTAVPGAVGKHKKVKLVHGTVTVFAVPTTITPATTAVIVTGNVKANSRCRKHRTVGFEYVSGGVLTPTGATVPTRPNGDYAAMLAPPATDADGTAVVRATVEQTFRKKKIKGKRKGANKGKKRGKIRKRKFNCLEINQFSNPLTIDAP